MTVTAFDTGHSSTSISAGLGLVRAREILGGDNYVISVIGDGSLTGGMAYEAMNNAARLKSNFIIVLNDNNMSISENVGGMSNYLGESPYSGRLSESENSGHGFSEPCAGLRRKACEPDPPDQEWPQAAFYSRYAF